MDFESVAVARLRRRRRVSWSLFRFMVALPVDVDVPKFFRERGLPGTAADRRDFVSRPAGKLNSQDARRPPMLTATRSEGMRRLWRRSLKVVRPRKGAGVFRVEVSSACRSGGALPRERSCIPDRAPSTLIPHFQVCGNWAKSPRPAGRQGAITGRRASPTTDAVLFSPVSRSDVPSITRRLRSGARDLEWPASILLLRLALVADAQASRESTCPAVGLDCALDDVKSAPGFGTMHFHLCHGDSPFLTGIQAEF